MVVMSKCFGSATVCPAGYLMEFGLYAWQPDGSVDRKLKEGAKTLVRP